MKKDHRYKGISCQYKDVRTGQFRGLGNDLAKAELIAKQLNVMIGQELLDKEMKALIQQDKSNNITVKDWFEQYLKIIQDKVAAGDMKQTTFDSKRWALNPIIKKYKNLKLADLNTVTINKILQAYIIEKILQAYIIEKKTTMAQRVRSCLIDVFAEAIAAGHFPADKPNPAFVTKAPRPKVRRARLTLEIYQQVIAWSKENQMAYLWKSYLLAVVTGQRLSDVSKAQFKDVKKVKGVEYLEVVQSKTGTKLLIPLDLRLNAIDVSLREIISDCRDRIVSPYLFHHPRQVGRAAAGSRVRTITLSQGFAAAIRAVKKNWGENDPPSFHEMRSLSERLYREQGVNTQELLGHKHQTMTDTYADARGHDYIIVKTGLE